MTHTIKYDGGDGWMHDIKLDRDCSCIRFGTERAAPSPVCPMCHGLGLTLTENGRQLLTFIRTFSEVPA